MDSDIFAARPFNKDLAEEMRLHLEERTEQFEARRPEPQDPNNPRPPLGTARS